MLATSVFHLCNFDVLLVRECILTHRRLWTSNIWDKWTQRNISKCSRTFIHNLLFVVRRDQSHSRRTFAPAHVGPSPGSDLFHAPLAAPRAVPSEYYSRIAVRRISAFTASAFAKQTSPVGSRRSVGVWCAARIMSWSPFGVSSQRQLP